MKTEIRELSPEEAYNERKTSIEYLVEDNVIDFVYDTDGDMLVLTENKGEIAIPLADLPKYLRAK